MQRRAQQLAGEERLPQPWGEFVNALPKWQRYDEKAVVAARGQSDTARLAAVLGSAGSLDALGRRICISARFGADMIADARGGVRILWAH